MRILMIVLCLIFITYLSATIINIPADYSTIQEGVDVSVNADTVLVQPGTYVENINYNGKLIIVASLFLTTQDITYISQTIIEGDNYGSVVAFESGEGSTAILSGFTIMGGLAWDGGGIYCENSNPSLDNLIISDNYVFGNGGGIFCEDSNLTLENVTIINNSTDNDGGGIFLNNSNAILENVTINSNLAENDGGGIFCVASNPSLENITINGNLAENDGGGISYSDSTPSLINLTICNNSAFFYGGGIRLDNSNAILENIDIRDNSVNYYGGGISLNNSDIMLGNVIISNNSANQAGGGIFISSSNSILENVTICNNSTYGSGGGGIFLNNSNSSLVNCILWNDMPVEIYCNPDYDPSSITISFSDIQDGEVGIVTNNNGTIYWLEGNIDEDPFFVGTGDHPFMLQDLSPCVNSGIPDTTGLNLPEFDLAGNPRVYGGRIDMGTYENQNVVVSTNEALIPLVTKLNQNYPNPFNPTTTISFSIQEDSDVKLSIYNIKGQKKRSLLNDQISAGEHSIVWNGENASGVQVSSGVYLYKLKVNDKTELVKKCLLLK